MEWTEKVSSILTLKNVSKQTHLPTKTVIRFNMLRIL